MVAKAYAKTSTTEEQQEARIKIAAIRHETLNFGSQKYWARRKINACLDDLIRRERHRLVRLPAEGEAPIPGLEGLHLSQVFVDERTVNTSSSLRQAGMPVVAVDDPGVRSAHTGIDSTGLVSVKGYGFQNFVQSYQTRISKAQTERDTALDALPQVSSRSKFLAALRRFKVLGMVASTRSKLLKAAARECTPPVGIQLSAKSERTIDLISLRRVPPVIEMDALLAEVEADLQSCRKEASQGPAFQVLEAKIAKAWSGINHHSALVVHQTACFNSRADVYLAPEFNTAGSSKRTQGSKARLPGLIHD